MSAVWDCITDIILNHLSVIELIVFWYPVSMGLLWVIGSLIYYYRIERKEPLPLTSTPMVSILVPAYNEEANIALTIERLNELTYPNYEIIIINDGSSDNSASIEAQLAEQYKKVRFVNLKENCGKANALYLGLMTAKGEYLVCVDGDSYLDKDCLQYMIAHFINPNNGERVGAVTGNPRVRNRNTLLAKIQLCEYASIISLIKRTQRIWGKVMTVSGVVVAYRKRALLDCGLWDRDLITEDIGVTWKLERNFWDIRYEPRAICWMLVPETLSGIIKQRKRWAQGGQEVLFRHVNIVKSWSRRRMLPILIEQIMSTLWIILWLLLTLVEIFKLCYHSDSYMPYLWKSQFLSFICIGQFLVAMLLERKYDKEMMRNYAVAAWYPLIYWIVNGLVSLFALPSTIKSRNKKLATWNSPDRGITEDESPSSSLSSNQASSEAAATSETTEHTPPSVTTQKEADIIKGRQKTWKKVIELCITVFAWLFILSYVTYVIYGFVSLALNIQPDEIWIYNTDMLLETKHLLYITFIIFLVETLFMIFWKEYNRRKYGKLNRRKFKPDVATEELALYFNQEETFIQKLHNDNIITLEKNIIPDEFKGVPVDFKLIREDS